MPPFTFPPAVPGATQGPPGPSPIETFARAMQARPETDQATIMQILALVRQLSPRMDPIKGRILRAIMTPPMTPMDARTEPLTGSGPAPSPGTVVPVGTP